MEVENEVQFTHVAEVSVKHLHKVMHKLQRDQLIVTAVNAHNEIKTCIALVDYLSCRSHLCSDILAAVETQSHLTLTDSSYRSFMQLKSVHTYVKSGSVQKACICKHTSEDKRYCSNG